MSEPTTVLVAQILDQMGGPLQSVRLSEPMPGCLELSLARPQVRNALDETMIREVTQVLVVAQRCCDEQTFRLLHLCGEGSVFCAGADLDMMARLGASGFESNRDDARRLARLFEAVAGCPVPVVVSVQGAAIGGGFGLTVCADAVVTHDGAVFATTEVKLGLAPAVISPYILRKIGLAAASLPLLSGQRLDAQRALALGLVQKVVPRPEDVQLAAHKILSELLSCAPHAQRETKRLITAAVPLPSADLRTDTESSIARLRSAPEAQYGLACFFAKRVPEWHLPPERRTVDVLQSQEALADDEHV
jgi:methylglutaconyl-CoA hydratase